MAWLHPRHVLLAPMTAVAVVSAASGGVTTISGRVVGYARETSAAGTAGTGDTCAESVRGAALTTSQKQSIRMDPELAVSMPSILE